MNNLVCKDLDYLSDEAFIVSGFYLVTWESTREMNHTGVAV